LLLGACYVIQDGGHINSILYFFAKLEIINGNVSKGYASVLRTAVADKKSSFKQIQEKPCTSDGALKLLTLTEE